MPLWWETLAPGKAKHVWARGLGDVSVPSAHSCCDSNIALKKVSKKNVTATSCLVVLVKERNTAAQLCRGSRDSVGSGEAASGFGVRQLRGGTELGQGQDQDTGSTL